MIIAQLNDVVTSRVSLWDSAALLATFTAFTSGPSVGIIKREFRQLKETTDSVGGDLLWVP